MKTLIILTAIFLCCSVKALAEMQHDVINRDAISFDNVTSGVDGSVQFRSGAGLDSNPDFFFDSTNVSLGVGTNSPTLGGILPEMKFLGVVESKSAFIGAITHATDPGFGSTFFVARTRGTKTSPSTVLNGDRLANVTAWGFGSTFYGLSAEIIFEVAGVPSGNTVPGRINFRAESGSGLVNVMSIVNNRVQYFDTGTKPTCNSSTRFSLWFDEGGAGVKDTVEVCAKDAGDSYAWRAIY